MANMNFFFYHLTLHRPGNWFGSSRTYFILRAATVAAMVLLATPTLTTAQTQIKVASKEADPFVIKISVEALEDLRKAPPSLRLSHLLTLAKAQIKLGDFGGARLAIVEARNEPSLLPLLHHGRLKDLVDISAELEDGPSVLSWIAKLPIDAQISAVGAYGVAMARKQDTAVAIGIVERLEAMKEALPPDVSPRPATPLPSNRTGADFELLNLGMELAINGAISPAEGIVAKLDNPIRQVQLLGAIARHQLKVGALEAGKVTLHQMQDFAEGKKDFGFSVLSEAVLAYAACGDVKNVIALITELPEPMRPGTLSAAGRQFLKDNDPLPILEIASAFEIDAKILARAASLAYQAGHIEEAEKMSNLALRFASSFAEIIDAHVAVHNFEAATNAVAKLPTSAYGHQPKIVSILTAEVEAKNKAAIDATIAATLKFVGKPVDPTINGFLNIAVKLANAGYEPEAKSILTAVKHFAETKKGWALVNDLKAIRARVAEMGDQEEVKRLTGQIEAANGPTEPQSPTPSFPTTADQAMMVQVQAALAALDSPNDGSDAAVRETLDNALAAVHQNGQLLQVILMLHNAKQSALRSKTLDLADNGHMGEATTLALTLNGMERNSVLENLAVGQEKAGNFIAAYDIDEKIPAPSVRGYALVTLLSTMAATK